MYQNIEINPNLRIRVLPTSHKVAIRVRMPSSNQFWSVYATLEEWKRMVDHVEHEHGEGSTDEE